VTRDEVGRLQRDSPARLTWGRAKSQTSTMAWHLQRPSWVPNSKPSWETPFATDPTAVTSSTGTRVNTPSRLSLPGGFNVHRVWDQTLDVDGEEHLVQQQDQEKLGRARTDVERPRVAGGCAGDSGEDAHERCNRLFIALLCCRGPSLDAHISGVRQAGVALRGSGRGRCSGDFIRGCHGRLTSSLGLHTRARDCCPEESMVPLRREERGTCASTARFCVVVR